MTALEQLKFYTDGKNNTDKVEISVWALNRIINALSQEPKSGKWINDKNDIPICSRCGYIPQYDRAIDDYEYSNYCPACGAKMESEDKE